ncbi:MAG: glycosyltransferase family 39 protein [Candidatus Paceibacteria bacterium]
MNTQEIFNHRDRLSLSEFDKYDYVLTAILSVAFILFTAVYFDFTIDDVYITLRFSKHLAGGHGLVWNIGGPPTEGYTSFLWVIIGSIPHLFSIPADAFVKFFSILMGLGSIIGVYYYARTWQTNQIAAFIAAGYMAFNPAFAAIVVSGMETALGTFLVFLSAVFLIETISEYRRRYVIGLYVVLFLAMLTRPGLVVFAATTLFVLATVLYQRDRVKQALHLTKYGIGLAFLPGVVYMIWRVAYFGYIFPLPFTVKSSGSLFVIRGMWYVFEFTTVVVGPLIVVSLIYFIKKSDISFESQIEPLLPVIVGTIVYMVLFFFIKPWQGDLWRFQMPVIAVITLTSGFIIDNVINAKFTDIQYRRVFVIIFVLFLLLIPLHTAADVRLSQNKRTVEDRVATGKALSGVSGEDLNMVVTESGAIPYYSKWNSIDTIGLSNNRVAHNGFDREMLEESDPELIQVLVHSHLKNPVHKKSPVIGEYVENSKYRIAAVTIKQETNFRGQYHMFLVDSKDPKYEEISCKLLTINNTEYKDRSIFEYLSNGDIQTSSITQQKCLEETV